LYAVCLTAGKLLDAIPAGGYCPDMKLIFHGTRGKIEAQSKRHDRHAVLEARYLGKGVIIDCGENWLGRLDELRPRAIVITHAHPDHAWGLAEGAPCPVYATREAWETLEEFPIAERRIIEPRRPFTVRGIRFEAFAVQHSIRAPAVGYRISAGAATIFYAPDLVYIHEREEALRGCRLYIGDGATVDGQMVRKSEDGQLFGHTPVRTQLTWCRKEGIPKMIVTHCGSQIVENEAKGIGDQVAAYAEERGVEVEIAHDGLELILR